MAKDGLSITCRRFLLTAYYLTCYTEKYPIYKNIAQSIPVFVWQTLFTRGRNNQICIASDILVDTKRIVHSLECYIKYYACQCGHCRACILYIYLHSYLYLYIYIYIVTKYGNTLTYSISLSIKWLKEINICSHNHLAIYTTAPLTVRMAS